MVLTGGDPSYCFKKSSNERTEDLLLTVGLWAYFDHAGGEYGHLEPRCDNQMVTCLPDAKATDIGGFLDRLDYLKERLVVTVRIGTWHKQHLRSI